MYYAYAYTAILEEKERKKIFLFISSSIKAAFIQNLCKFKLFFCCFFFSNSVFSFFFILYIYKKRERERCNTEFFIYIYIRAFNSCILINYVNYYLFEIFFSLSCSQQILIKIIASKI